MMYKYSVLLLQVIITLTTATDSSSSDNTCHTTDSVHQSIASLTKLVTDILTKSSHEIVTNFSKDNNVASLVQFAMMQQMVSGSYLNTGNYPVHCQANDNSNESVVITKLDEVENRLNKKLDEKLDKLTTDMTAIKHILNITDSTSYPSSSLLHSCEEIKANWPDSPSDYYIIADSNGHARHVYCHMEELCDSKGGWMRVAYLNMSDSTEECPPGFRLYDVNGVRACGRPQSSPAGYCQSVKFPSYSISYSQVCGRVTGYQYGSPDGIAAAELRNNLNAAYVDGVSLTHGNPRQHIWTFIAGLQENVFYSNGVHECPCAPNSPVTPQSFVGNDYFCESGCPGQFKPGVLYTDPLWDGKQCGEIEKPCCQAPGIPWFHKTFNFPTTDYIELRVCANQAVTDEDIPVGFYDIYVK